jgi:hypothetical protein
MVIVELQGENVKRVQQVDCVTEKQIHSYYYGIKVWNGSTKKFLSPKILTHTQKCVGMNE